MTCPIVLIKRRTLAALQYFQRDIGYIISIVNPYTKNPFEEDVLKAYWAKWFTEMGVQDFLIKRADLPVNLDESIQKFILTP